MSANIIDCIEKYKNKGVELHISTDTVPEYFVVDMRLNNVHVKNLVRYDDYKSVKDRDDYIEMLLDCMYNRLLKENKKHDVRVQIDCDKLYNTMLDHLSDPCRTCSNHPSNGGSGICNCILGLPLVIS